MSVRRAGAAFGRFWWDFIIGDTPEVAAGVAVIVVAAWLLAVRVSAVAVVLMPLAVVFLLLSSTWRGRRSL
ncbi:MAG TPA: hypothetical protein VMV23_03885 [Candidatus Nanopelagicaceae bacterium]|nr:hypothetical protein [Candidatus Nanopelagicaceae bacterium]